MDLVGVNLGLDLEFLLLRAQFLVLSFDSVLDEVLVVQIGLHFVVLRPETL